MKSFREWREDNNLNDFSQKPEQPAAVRPKTKFLSGAKKKEVGMIENKLYLLCLI